MLGEAGTEQFTITTRRDGKQISAQKIHDPFIRTTITICVSRWDLFKGLFAKQYKAVLQVNVDASDGMMRTIMMLDPAEIELETQRMKQNRQDRGETIGYVNECNAKLG
jgi:hypothetical protein